MPYILIDLHYRSLLPLTYSKPVSHLFVGMDRIIDKWSAALGGIPGICTAEHLHEIFPGSGGVEGIYINASLIPNEGIIHAIKGLKRGQMIAADGIMLAMHCDKQQAQVLEAGILTNNGFAISDLAEERLVYPEPLHLIRKPADIFALNGDILSDDFDRKTANHRTILFPKGVTVIGDRIFVAEGAVLRPCILNAENGPIYIDKGAEIMEGSTIRGGFYLGEGSQIKMGAKIYGPTSIGKHCKVGGEVNNSVMDDYSNKGHDGFLGNSVVGSWCNLGADTNTSNLKNNYSAVRVWDYSEERAVDTGRQFHGLIMADHSKAGINTMFNTGTVVGMCCNVYGAGFPQKFIPSFSWGNDLGFIDFDMQKAFEMAEAMMARRGVPFTEADKALFQSVFDQDARWRN